MNHVQTMNVRKRARELKRHYLHTPNRRQLTLQRQTTVITSQRVRKIVHYQVQKLVQLPLNRLQNTLTQHRHTGMHKITQQQKLTILVATVLQNQLQSHRLLKLRRANLVHNPKTTTTNLLQRSKRKVLDCYRLVQRQVEAVLAVLAFIMGH